MNPVRVACIVDAMWLGEVNVPSLALAKEELPIGHHEFQLIIGRDRDVNADLAVNQTKVRVTVLEHARSRVQSKQTHGLLREGEGIDDPFEIRTTCRQRRVDKLPGVPPGLNVVRATAERAQRNAAPLAGIVTLIEV